MAFTRKFASLLLLLMCAAGLVSPALADDGDSAMDFPGGQADLSRPGSVIVFPKFVRDGVNAKCAFGNALLDGLCLPRTEIELGAVCPTRFTFGTQANMPCPEHQAVRVRFRWVCPPTKKDPYVCKTAGFEVMLTVNGKIIFTADDSRLPDKNQVNVPKPPCDRGYLIGWVVDEQDRPIKYDGLIGEATIRDSGTAAASYRGIPIQAYIHTPPGDLITLVPDPLGLEPDGLPFQLPGLPPFQPTTSPYRVVTGQVTGDVKFDESVFDVGDVSTSLILLTLDVRSDAANFPTHVPLDFWNGFETKLPTSTSVEFVCWGEFQLSKDIDPRLTKSFMGTRNGIVQSDEAVKVPKPGIPDVITESDGLVTLLGLVQTTAKPFGSFQASRSIIEFYNNGIRYQETVFYP